MYKLTAYLANGMTFVTNSAQHLDLCRIASNLGAVRYKITLNDNLVLYAVL